MSSLQGKFKFKFKCLWTTLKFIGFSLCIQFIDGLWVLASNASLMRKARHSDTVGQWGWDRHKM